MPKLILAILTVYSVHSYGGSPIFKITSSTDPAVIKKAIEVELLSSDYHCYTNDTQLSYPIERSGASFAAAVVQHEASTLLSSPQDRSHITVAVETDEDRVQIKFELSKDLKHIDKFDLLRFSVRHFKVNDGTIYEPHIREAVEYKTRINGYCIR